MPPHLWVSPDIISSRTLYSSLSASICFVYLSIYTYVHPPPTYRFWFLSLSDVSHEQTSSPWTMYPCAKRPNLFFFFFLSVGRYRRDCFDFLRAFDAFRESKTSTQPRAFGLRFPCNYRNWKCLMKYGNRSNKFFGNRISGLIVCKSVKNILMSRNCFSVENIWISFRQNVER